MGTVINRIEFWTDYVPFKLFGFTADPTRRVLVLKDDDAHPDVQYRVYMGTTDSLEPLPVTNVTHYHAGRADAEVYIDTPEGRIHVPSAARKRASMPSIGRERLFTLDHDEHLLVELPSGKFLVRYR